MPFFGKSWRKKEGPPQSSSALASTQQADHNGMYAVPHLSAKSCGHRRQNRAYRDQTAQPQGWIVAPFPQYQAVILPNDLLAPSPQPPRPQEVCGSISKLKLASVTNLLAGDVPRFLPGAAFFNNEVAALTEQGTQCFSPGAALYDLIASKLDTVVTLIDSERFSGDERELVVYPPPPHLTREHHYSNGNTGQELVKARSRGLINDGASTALVSTNYFTKVNLYANSRLIQNLPPMKL